MVGVDILGRIGQVQMLAVYRMAENAGKDLIVVDRTDAPADLSNCCRGRQ